MGKGKGVKEEIGRGELRQQREGAMEAKKQIDGGKVGAVQNVESQIA